jgi:GMP synthase (glutamine-hydrolysing)
MTGTQPLLLRCESDPDQEYHCDALAGLFPRATEYSLPAGERPNRGAVADAGAAVVSGSTAGVYEDDRCPWIDDGRRLVREFVDAGVPTLGVCFGHQLVNDALGGRVEHRGMRAGLVEAAFDDDPLFEGVSPVVPAIHGDVVVETGAELDPVARVREYDYAAFATRHRTAPVWTIQFHPEIGAEHEPRLADAFDWQQNGYAFADVTGERLAENFRRLARQHR